GPVGGDEADVSGGDVEDGRDGGGAVELLHGCSPWRDFVPSFPTMEKLRCIHAAGNNFVAH
ncbi:hypothetical protein ACFWZJ_33990, partial [Streptomyces massasporeus]